MLALESPHAVNQVYTIAQPKSFRLVDWVELAAKCLGVKPNLVNMPADVIKKADFEYVENWTYSATFTVDISKAVTELGFRPTPIETWTATTAHWYQETIHENDSPGYADREKEIEFAEKYLEKIASLDS